MCLYVVEFLEMSLVSVPHIRSFFSAEFKLFLSSKLLSTYNLMCVDKQKVEECSSAAYLLSSSSSRGGSPCIPSTQEPTDAQTLNVHENELPKNNKVSNQISKDDLLCSACKELLVRPVVLNCGHGILSYMFVFDKYFDFRLLENSLLYFLMW